MNEQIENGMIESTMLGVQDHGIFTAWLNLKFDGTGQGFGGYALDGPGPVRFGDRVGCAWGMEYIRLLLDTLEVEKWEALPGKHCRVKRDERRGTIQAVGHIIKDRWFCPKTDLAHLVPKPAGE